MLQQRAHSKVDAVHGPAKTGEQMRSCLEIALAGRVLDWRPEIRLEEGLTQTLAYYREKEPHES
jgi:UDP-glucose 4-epimerase